MSSYYEAIHNAEQVIAAAESGAHDTAFGISPEQRAALNRVHGEGRLSMADFNALVSLGHEGRVLAVQAHHDDRIDTHTDDTEETQ